MYKYHFLLCFVIFGGVQSKVFSQENHSTKKIEIDVIKVYERVVADGYINAFVYEKLATEYFKKNDFGNSKKYFEKLFSLQKKKNFETEVKYKQCLKVLNKSKDALVIVAQMFNVHKT